MKITESFNNNSSIIFEYSDVDSFDSLDKKYCSRSHGVCFCEGKLLIVFGYFGGNEREWGFVGGQIEEGESPEEALVREVKEESNMEVVSFLPIGYQKITKIDNSFKYELRYVCKVKTLGPFVEDPANGNIIEVKLIEPAEYKKYVDWGRIGERLVERALWLLPLLPN